MKFKIKVNKIVKRTPELDCPPATQDLELNTKNRNAAIKAEHIQYGPLNLSDEKYYDRAAKHWNTEPEVAKKSKCSNCIAFDISPRMLECLPGPVSEPIEDEEGKLGYCWMHHFKCHSARTCYTWAAGGPISDDKTSAEWQEKNAQSLKEEDEQYGMGRMKKKKKHAKELGVELQEKWSEKYKKSIDCDNPKGFSQKAHCAGRKKNEAKRIPRKKGQPAKSDKHSDLYTDEDPKGTIHGLKFATVADAEKSVNKIKRSGRSHAHKIQAAVAMEQRAKAADKKSAAAVYRRFINSMKKKTKMKEGAHDNDLKSKIEKALKDEGGAAGMSALKDHTGASEKEIKKAIKDMDNVGLHVDGDYILGDKKQIDIQKIVREEVLDFFLSEKDDRCTRIAKRKYDVWPSAYASGAVVRCRKGKIWKGLKEEEVDSIIDEEIENYFKEIAEASLDEKKKAKTDYSKEKKSGLHGWFSRQGGKGKSKGWVDCNTCRKDPKTGRKKCKACGRQKGEKRAKYPSCRPTPAACGTKGKGKKWGKKK